MTSRASARRYARALFDVALAEGKDLKQVQQEIRGFSELVAGNEGLARALTNPAIPASRKRGVIEQLIARAGNLQSAVAKLLLLLADRDRLVLLPELAQAFEDRLMDHVKVVRAEVVSAVSLPAESVAALKEGLGRATGRDVQLAARVDTSIIGGAVTRIGSTVFDGSVTRQLEKMKEMLIAESHDGHQS
jgi:F-type H+-transporting ATPase subunit delta